uniref:Secreted protein n=1 Tax=Macrostomum lignano TaxID=282301 RepID=A0A1I8FLT1_9PLAT
MARALPVKTPVLISQLWFGVAWLLRVERVFHQLDASSAGFIPATSWTS